MNLKKINFRFLAVTLFILFLYNLPTFYPYFKTPKDMVYLGQVSWFDPWDINVYVSAIRWSQHFGLYFQNAYTTEVHKPIIFYPLYTLFGIVFPNINPYLLFNISTLLIGGFLLVMIYQTTKLFLKNKKLIYYIFLTIPLAGGFGWIFFPKIYTPDIAMTPFTFANTFQRAHEALAISFYFLSLVLFYTSINNKSLKLTLLSGISGILFTPLYPFYLLSFYIICGIYNFFTFIKTKNPKVFRYFLLLVLITFPFGSAYSLYLKSSVTFNNVLAPSIDTPTLFLLCIGYGILTPFLILQIFSKKWDSFKIFLNIWFFSGILLAYTPLSFARYYLRGLFLPAVLLVTNFLTDYFNNKSSVKIHLKYMFIAVTPLLFTTNILIIVARLATAIGIKNASSSWTYMKTSDYQIFNTLDRVTVPPKGILAPKFISNLIPAHTLNRVYYGHDSQTPASSEKSKNAAFFFDNLYSDTDAKTFITNSQIDYILVTNIEVPSGMSADTPLPAYSFLKVFSQNPDWIIYSTE